MSSSKNSILFFMMGNFIIQKEIGTYTNPSLNSSDLINLQKASTELFSNYNESENSKSKTNKLILEDFNIYYTLTSTNIFYSSAVKKDSIYNENETLIFKLFEDIEVQGIKKLTDKNGQLSRIGRQNLKFCIEQSQEKILKTKNNSSIVHFFKNKNNNEIEKDNESDNSKISLLSTQINEISNDVKDGVKNLLINSNDIQEISNKSEKIKDLSFKYQKDAAYLEKKIRCRKITSRVIIALIIVIIIAIIVYFIFK